MSRPRRSPQPARPASYTAQELDLLLDDHTPHHARTVEALRHSQVWVLSVQPLRYALARPAAAPHPALPTTWQAKLRRLEALSPGRSGLSLSVITDVWQVHPQRVRWMLAHLTALGYLRLRGEHYHLTGLTPPTRPHPAPPLSLQTQRLSAAPWPVTLAQAAKAWGLGHNAANTYLYRLCQRGFIERKSDGRYHIK